MADEPTASITVDAAPADVMGGDRRLRRHIRQLAWMRSKKVLVLETGANGRLRPGVVPHRLGTAQGLLTSWHTIWARQ